MKMTYEQGALVEPAAVAVHAVRQSKLKEGEAVAVFGCGPNWTSCYPSS